MSKLLYEEAVRIIEPGLYQHFKGNYYEVLCIARHSESLEPMVVYKALYGDGGVWTRPADMWNETVEHRGEAVKRFRKLSPVERVSFYEVLFDEVSAAKDKRSSDMDLKVPQSGANAGMDSQPGEIALKLRILDDYYTSGQWREDYEADEKGLWPEDLKRGVLSQDALYDLLSE